MHDLSSGIAVVTGASEGLGRALCGAFVAKGITTVGLSRSVARLQNLRQELATDLFHPIATDVGNPDAVRAAFDQIAQNHGAVSMLINNAALYPHRDTLDETSESFMHTVSVNLGGAFSCSRAALEPMVAQGYGRIINVGSFADIAPAPAAAAYSVSKGAQRILTRALVADLADRFPDIIINDWMPGILNTNMGLAHGLDPKQAAARGVQLALRQERTLNGLLFEIDRSKPPAIGWKRKMLNMILRQNPKQFFLDP